MAKPQTTKPREALCDHKKLEEGHEYGLNEGRRVVHTMVLSLAYRLLIPNIEGKPLPPVEKLQRLLTHQVTKAEGILSKLLCVRLEASAEQAELLPIHGNLGPSLHFSGELKISVNGQKIPPPPREET